MFSREMELELDERLLHQQEIVQHDKYAGSGLMASPGMWLRHQQISRNYRKLDSGVRYWYRSVKRFFERR